MEHMCCLSDCVGAQVSVGFLTGPVPALARLTLGSLVPLNARESGCFQRGTAIVVASGRALPFGGCYGLKQDAIPLEDSNL